MSKILSFQPGSLYQNGGAARLLRRLYKGREQDVTSIFVKEGASPINKGMIDEIVIRAVPVHRSWMRWKLRFFFTWLREHLFFDYNAESLKREVLKIDHDIIHVINHGRFSAILCEDRFLNGKKLWASFHDHFSLCSSFEDTNLLWNRADRRLVISNQLAREYQKLFGVKEFEIITDGVAENEFSHPKYIEPSEINIYFGGLLHIDYYPLFRLFADALDVLSTEEQKFKFILRGTQEIDFLSDRNFIVEYRTDFISDDQIKQEIDSADILYMPVKFNKPDFYLYSLSTKMVGYLAAPGTILYHGPNEGAAYELVKQNEAAIICSSNKLPDMLNAIDGLLVHHKHISSNAKKIVSEKFDLDIIRRRFWAN